MRRWMWTAAIVGIGAALWTVGRWGRWDGAVRALVERSAVADSSPDLSTDARLLVVSADGHDAALSAILGELDTIGIPYTVVSAAALPMASLADGPTHGLYNGVILVDCSGANAPAASSPAPLVSYLSTFAVRSACLYAAPDASLGFGGAESVDTKANPLGLTFTPAGMAVFGWYATAAPVSVSGVPATVAPANDPALTALLVDDAGRAGVALRAFPDGREVLLLTFDQAPGAPHSRSLLTGVASWVSRGVFIGEKRAFFGPQVDDVFLGTVLRDGTTFRLGADDLRNAARWQDQARAGAAGGNLSLTLPFNGVEVRDDDPLTQAAREVGQQFQWVSHTFDHHRLDAADYARMTDELTQNDAVMTKYGFGPYDRDSLVTPDVSGLQNAPVMKAAADWGIQQLVCDTSYAGCKPSVPNTAVYNPLAPSLLMVPRLPSGLYANVSMRDDWVAMWNSLNQARVGHAATYDEILDWESDRLLEPLLAGDMGPWMFHQANLRAYDGSRTLLTDLLDKLLEKYRAVRVLPLLTLTMSDVGARLRARSNLQSSGLVATVGPGRTITLRADQTIRVPVTGARADGAESYGAVVISMVDVPAGGQVSVPLAAGADGDAASSLTGNRHVGATPGPTGASGCGCELSTAARGGRLAAGALILAAAALAVARRRAGRRDAAIRRSKRRAGRARSCGSRSPIRCRTRRRPWRTGPRSPG